MICLNVILQVKDAADVEKVRTLLAEQRRLSLEEPGCLRFEVYHSQNDATVFILNEQWESQAAVEAHRRAHAYTTVYAPQVLPLVNRTPHPATLVE
ncbi:MAG: antibiotic biosynthesis monooxygenase [Planctomycetales bacterium]|nr:antibiotic biosynthesis monooxygenase [Planctomycetales bacterium]MBN8628145.1 antibiotic biosynthesis monooxygenase [Planctomycetota bacterium]